jgi:hypothetical protein
MKEKCGAHLVVVRYGMGTKYHCPVCDTRKNMFGITMVTWTNGPANIGDKCQNPKALDRIKKALY